jgi:hypothetical protein
MVIFISDGQMKIILKSWYDNNVILNKMLNCHSPRKEDVISIAAFSLFC